MFETTKLPHWLLHNWVLHCIVAEAALCVWLQLGRTLASRVGIRVNQTWIDFFKASLSISKSTFQTYWFFLRNIQNIHDFGAIKRSKHCMRSARDRFLYIWPPPHVLGLRFEKVLTVTFLCHRLHNKPTRPLYIHRMLYLKRPWKYSCGSTTTLLNTRYFLSIQRLRFQSFYALAAAYCGWGHLRMHVLPA